MKYTKSIIVLACVVVVIAWYLLSPLFIVRELDEASPLEAGAPSPSASLREEAEGTKIQPAEPAEQEKFEEQAATYEGIFASRAHEVSGKAIVIRKDGRSYLRFEDFETLNGPDLRIILSRDESDRDALDLGPIKATKGNVNYLLPDTTKIETYNHALVWCRAFRVLFGAATLVQKKE